MTRRARITLGTATSLQASQLHLDELRQRACRQGYRDLCAFTHLPDYFIQRGFSIVPHLSIPERVFSDFVTCLQGERCAQYAMVQPLDLGAAESTAGTPVAAASAWLDHTAVFSPHA